MDPLRLIVACVFAFLLAWAAVTAIRLREWKAARRKHARELRNEAIRRRNAERRERKHHRALVRVERRMHQVLEAVQRGPDMAWAENVANRLNTLTANDERLERALVHANLLAKKERADFSNMLDERVE